MNLFVVWKWSKGSWQKVVNATARWLVCLSGMISAPLLKLSLVSLLIVCVLGLSGCGWIWQKLPTQIEEIGNPCPKPPAIDTFILRDTPPTAAVIEGMPLVIFTPRDYENLGKNQQDILLALRQQVSVIGYYKRCLVRVDSFTLKVADDK